MLPTFPLLWVAPSSRERRCPMSTPERLFDVAEGFMDDHSSLGPSHRSHRVPEVLPYFQRVARGRPFRRQCTDDFTDEEDEMVNLWWPFQRCPRDRAARRASDSVTSLSSPRKRSKKEDCSCSDTAAAKPTSSCTAAGKDDYGNNNNPVESAASAAEEDLRASAVCPSRGATPWTLRVPLGGTPEPQDLRVWTRDNVLTVQAHTQGEGGATSVRHVASLPSHVAPGAITSRLSRDGILTVTCTQVQDGPRDVPVTREWAEHQEQEEEKTRAEQEVREVRAQHGDGETQIGLNNAGNGNGSQNSSNTTNNGRRREDETVNDPNHRHKSSQAAQ